MKSVKLFSLALLFTVKICAQGGCPTNIDFEQGTFANWDCFTGSTSVVGGVNQINLTSSPPTFGRHEIISSPTDLDPYGGFRQRCPFGGNYSVKLGNNLPGNQAEGISYTFQVPVLADTFSLTYYYAVVFEDPNHQVVQQPRFFVSAYDVLTGNVINCASYSYVSNGSIPGFQVSEQDPGVLYKDWTPVSIDFAGLGGRTVRLEFKTADCTLGGHFGYAYLDVGTGCLGTLATAPYCVETNLVQLNAPYGFQTYTWYNSDYTAVIGNQQVLDLSPPPAVNTIFHVDMIPYPGYGCRDTAKAIVVPMPVPDTPVAPNEYTYCQYDNATALTATPNDEHVLTWYTAATGGIGSSLPLVPSTTQVGTFYYYVTQKQLFGCESKRKRIAVHIAIRPSASFTINNNRQCQNNNQFVLTNTSIDTVASTLLWSFGDGQTSTNWDASHQYNTGFGNFNIKLTVSNMGGCIDESDQFVWVIPKPISVFDNPAIICANQTPIIVTDRSVVPGGISTITNWQWWFNGNLVTGQNPPPFTAAPGNLTIRLVTKTSEGCVSDTASKPLLVHYLPVSSFDFTKPLCNNEVVRFTNHSSLPAAAAPDVITTWNWQFSDAVTANTPDMERYFAPGFYHAQLKVTSNVGCEGIADSTFTIYPKPSIQVQLSDSCVKRNILYKAIDNNGDVAKWLWDLGSGFAQGPAQLSKTYFTSGDRPFKLMGQTVHGCRDTVTRPFTVYSISTSLPVDTVTAKDEPVLLNPNPVGDTTGAQYTWIPATGLDNAFIKTPISLLATDQFYNLKVVSIHGCDSYSRILVRRYEGPTLYIPTAFTPNGDGLNDVLKVFPAGIRSFDYLSIYNRNGQRIFHTTDYSKGWDGTYKGAGVDPGNYVVVARAIDYKGNVILKKQNLVVLR